MKRVRAPLLIALVMILAASACLVGLPAPSSLPTSPAGEVTEAKEINPNAITAAFTVTRENPTQTPSVTMTAFPSITPLPTATATFTETPYGFKASETPTIFVIPTKESIDIDEGATDDWGSPTRCSLITKSPMDWAVVHPGTQYKASWTLYNSGIKTWQANQMVLVYVDGAKLTAASQKKTSLNSDVRVGRTITPIITITAPKLPGHYRAVWGLRLLKDNRIFCTFTIKVFVQ